MSLCFYVQAPPYVLVFMCLFSYRVHSIFILRCFNDPVAILLLYFSIIFFFNHKWSVGCLIFRSDGAALG